MEGYKPAVFVPRKAGELRIAELDAGGENRPALAVQFETPDFLLLSRAEASAARALSSIRESAELMAAYGFGERKFDDEEMPGLARLIASVETAAHLWRDWNFAERDPANREVTVLELNRLNIVRLLEDPQLRLAWNAHLDAASPLEREEGNDLAASLNGSTAQAADIAATAENETPPAAEVSGASGESSAPA